jgi:integrase
MRKLSGHSEPGRGAAGAGDTEESRLSGHAVDHVRRRVSEVANLKAEDVDSYRGILWIRGDRGRKDRRTLLPPKLPELLRVYWRWRHPEGWLFPGEKPGTPISKESIFRACQKAGQDAGISKAVHRHLLRHAPAGSRDGPPHIQTLLGHAHLETTARFLLVADTTVR